MFSLSQLRQFPTARRLLIAGLCFVVFLAIFLATFSFTAPGRIALRLARDRIVWQAHDYPKIMAQAQKRLQQTTSEKILFPLPEARVVVYKKNRTAELYSGTKLTKRYKIALGDQPVGDKERKRDEKTPEGTFHICTRLNRSTYHLFMGLNYPLAEDAKRGLKAGLISKTEGQEIIRAEQKQAAPSWRTQLGGAIGLHGGGTELDWTDGCISFSNEDIEELWAATKYWTPVEIKP